MSASSGKTHTMLGEDLYSTLESSTNKHQDLKPLLFNAFKPLFQILPYDLVFSIFEYSGVDVSNHGIIPRVVKELFSSLKERYHYYTVSCKFVEIYNEKVCDLLKKQKKKVYSDFVTESVSLKSWEDARGVVTRGLSNRKTRATLMNDTSSRSHAVFSIFLTFQPNANEASLVNSRINLVDLAGSEQTGRIAQCNDEMKEGTSINTSLLHLGRVINKLAELSEKLSRVKDPKEQAEIKKKFHIPYRDSVLTDMLQHTLGGNSKTIMVATASPTERNVSETLSTLRYASRAKVICASTQSNNKETFDNELKRTIESAIERRMNFKRVKIHLLNKNKGDKGIVKNLPEFNAAVDEELSSYQRIKKFLDAKTKIFSVKQVAQVTREVVEDIIKDSRRGGQTEMKEKCMIKVLGLSFLQDLYEM